MSKTGGNRNSSSFAQLQNRGKGTLHGRCKDLLSYILCNKKLSTKTMWPSLTFTTCYHITNIDNQNLAVLSLIKTQADESSPTGSGRSEKLSWQSMIYAYHKPTETTSSFLYLPKVIADDTT